MGRKQVSAAESVWRERLARFDRGDLTVAEFCRREGVCNRSFYQWRKRLQPHQRQARRVEQAGQEPSAADLPGRFLPVNVAGLSVVEIEFPNGIKIRVPTTNAEVLKATILAGHEACQGVATC
jgi:transposase-like protein